LLNIYKTALKKYRFFEKIYGKNQRIYEF